MLSGAPLVGAHIVGKAQLRALDKGRAGGKHEQLAVHPARVGVALQAWGCE